MNVQVLIKTTIWFKCFIHHSWIPAEMLMLFHSNKPPQRRSSFSFTLCWLLWCFWFFFFSFYSTLHFLSHICPSSCSNMAEENHFILDAPYLLFHNYGSDHSKRDSVDQKSFFFQLPPWTDGLLKSFKNAFSPLHGFFSSGLACGASLLTPLDFYWYLCAELAGRGGGGGR